MGFNESQPIQQIDNYRLSTQDSRLQKVCAVMAAYKESETIAKVIQETKKYVDTVIVVDDGSTDNTAEIAQQHGAQVLRHSVNKGIGAAQQSGYDAAINDGFEYIIQIDADGQHDPKHIPEMLTLARECDMVIGSRFLNNSYRSYPFVRKLGISFFTLVVNLLAHAGITDVTSGYRVYRVESMKKLGRISSRHWAVEQTLEAGKKGFKIKEVSIEMPIRDKGKSQFSFLKYALYPFRMIWVVLKVMLLK